MAKIATNVIQGLKAMRTAMDEGKAKAEATLRKGGDDSEALTAAANTISAVKSDGASLDRIIKRAENGYYGA